jgi:hypothetical protein
MSLNVDRKLKERKISRTCLLTIGLRPNSIGRAKNSKTHWNKRENKSQVYVDIL